MSRQINVLPKLSDNSHINEPKDKLPYARCIQKNKWVSIFVDGIMD